MRTPKSHLSTVLAESLQPHAHELKSAHAAAATPSLVTQRPLLAPNTPRSAKQARGHALLRRLGQRGR